MYYENYDISTTAWIMVVLDDDKVDLSTFAAMRKKFGTQAHTANILGLTDGVIISKFENGKAKIDKRTYSLFLLVSNNHPYYTMELKADAEDKTVVFEPPSGEGIKIMREYAGLSQGRLAFLLGMMSNEKPNRQLISRYEKGVQNPSAQTWTLFLLITGQHPNYEIFPKSDINFDELNQE